MSPQLRRLLPLLGLVLLALIPVWRAAVLGETIGPVDHIRAMLDPAAPKPETPWNVLQADAILQFRTWRGLVFESWSQGHVPGWNPYSLLGTPLLGNAQSGALYPLHMLAGVTWLPLDHAIGLLAWFHLALAGVGTYRLCRALGTDRASAFFGGSAFMLSAFLLSWTPLASVPTTVAWIPWALFWITRRDWRWLAVSVGMMLLAGHLQFAAYGLIGALVFALAQGAWRMLPALALGGALAGAHLLPVLDFGQYSHRRTPPTSEGYAAYAKSAVQPFQFATLAVPTAQGAPNDPGGEISATLVPTYWPSLVKPGENFAEAAIGLSPIAIALLICAPWRTRRVGTVAAVGFAGFALMTATPFAQALYFGVPGWSATGSPGRAGVLFVLAGSVLAALGLHRLRVAPPRAALLRGLGGAGLIGVLVTVAGNALRPETPKGFDFETLTRYGSSANAAWLIIGLLLAAVTIGAAIQVKGQRYAPLFGVGAALFAFMTYAPGLIPTGPMPSLPTASENTRVAVINDRWSFFGTPRAIVPPNLLAAARIVDTGGYDSLIDRETKAMLDEANRADSPPPENGNMMFIKPTVDLARLEEWGVGEVWAKAPIPGLTVIGESNGVVRHALGGTLVDLSRSTLRAVTPHRLTISSVGVKGSNGNADYVRLPWRNLPGWTLDGKPLAPGPWLEGASTKPGEFNFVYRPPGLDRGLIVSGVALLILVASGFWGKRRDATPPAEPSE